MTDAQTRAFGTTINTRPTIATRLSQKIAEADAVARDLKRTRLQIEEELAELGFSQIKFHPDCVVASINGNTFRLGA